MDLRAITYVDFAESSSRVISICEPHKMITKILEIEKIYSDKEIIKMELPKPSSNNFFIEFSNKDYIYSGSYVLNEIVP